MGYVYDALILSLLKLVPNLLPLKFAKMNNIKLMLIACLLGVQLLNAQVCWIPTGAESWAMGGQSVAQPSVFGVLNNPAAIAGIHKPALGIYQEMRYRQQQLMLSALALVRPAKLLNMGLGIVQQGNTNYNQQKLTMSVARVLNAQVSLGINITFLGTHIDEQNYRGKLLGELGVMLKPTSALTLGCYLFNPTQVKFKMNVPEPLPAFIRTGFSYQFSSQLKLSGEFEHRILTGNAAKFGFAYTPVPALSLLAGWAQNPQYICFGTAFQYKKSRWCLAASRHDVLGITPHFSLIINPAQK